MQNIDFIGNKFIYDSSCEELLISMKVKLSGVKSIKIKGDYIKLDSLLKFASIVSTGGEAKILIQNDEVYVGKEICRARGKKIKPGDIVRCGEHVLLVKRENL
jgi:ribosome-associated protein